jgi:hypothetical protein
MEVKNKTKYVGARMTDDEREFLVRESKERGIRLSDYIRRTLLVNMPTVDKNNA